MPQRRTRAFLPPGRPGRWTVFAALALLQACSTAQIDSIPQKLGGLPEDAPQRPAEGPAYPAVHDMPPARAAPLLDEEQQKKLQADLIATRNRQPNQEKNRARDAQKKAKEDAKAKKKQEQADNPKRKRSSASQGGAAPVAPPLADSAGASRNP